MRHLLSLLAFASLNFACAAASTTAATPTPSGKTQPAPPTPKLGDATTTGIPDPSDSLIYVANLDEAKSIAARDQRQILMVFAGSDWCRPCIEFKRTVLDDGAFHSLAGQKYVVLYLDFPAKKRNELPAVQKAYNATLAEKYNQDGQFPRIYLLDAQGKTLQEMKFAGQDANTFATQLAGVARS